MPPMHLGHDGRPRPPIQFSSYLEIFLLLFLDLFFGRMIYSVAQYDAGCYVTSIIFLAVDLDVARLVPGLLLGPGGVAARTHVGKPEDRGGLVLTAGAHRDALL